MENFKLEKSKHICTNWTNCHK
uniref:Uncharacterized protein n=1 Tax=Anguilla anguilla TaxID=7936 RepID=A0A0E9R3V8_ANGAN